MWDVSSGEEGAFFEQVDAFNCVCATNLERTVLVAGIDGGKVHFLRMEGITPGPMIVTAWRRPNTWSEIPASTLGTEIPCPHCGKSIKLNPFTINVDWRQVAKAWSRGSR